MPETGAEMAAESIGTDVVDGGTGLDTNGNNVAKTGKALGSNSKGNAAYREPRGIQRHGAQ